MGGGEQGAGGGGCRSPSGAILKRREGTQSSTAISLHLQPAPSRISIAHIPQLQCLPNTHNRLQHVSLHVASYVDHTARRFDKTYRTHSATKLLPLVVFRKYQMQTNEQVKVTVFNSRYFFINRRHSRRLRLLCLRTSLQ